MVNRFKNNTLTIDELTINPMPDTLLYILDVCGTFVFAVSGGFKAARADLDLLGIMVLAVATGVGGGLIRDVLLGATPPAVFQDELYLVVCLLGGTAAFFGAPRIAARWNLVMAADAVGLGVFAALGAAKGSAFGLGPIGIVMMGALTATGGGVVRDMLVNEVPAVIRKDFYATAALIGGLCLVLVRLLGFGVPVQLIAAGLTTTSLRFYAMLKHVNLPRAQVEEK
jgi:uncharacterized membrane protein YeiH